MNYYYYYHFYYYYYSMQKYKQKVRATHLKPVRGSILPFHYGSASCISCIVNSSSSCSISCMSCFVLFEALAGFCQSLGVIKVHPTPGVFVLGRRKAR